MGHRVRSEESGVRNQKISKSTASHSSASNFTPPTSNEAKPLASISLDLDNKWSYLKTHGNPGWEEFPSYLDIFIPNVLELLDQLNLRITFFIVGQDAALEKNRDALKLITERGHEVGNHSFSHEPWLHLYTKDRIVKEIVETEEQILSVTGQKPVGFRGPGFSWSPNLLEALSELGYVYDASSLPTYLGPLARMYYVWTSPNFTEEEKICRKKLFGNFQDGLRPIKPYLWTLDSGVPLLEIPVTTMPILKIPFHLTYLLYLSRFSKLIMSLYFGLALALCRMTKTEPSFLLHPLDLLDVEQVPELAFFPGMNLHKDWKKRVFLKTLKGLSRHFNLTRMNIYAESILKQRSSKIGHESPAR